MLHGWQDTRHTFDAITPSVAQIARVIRVDMPGFGGSERPHEAWNVHSYVDFIAHFMQKIQVDPDVIVGHSFGGRVILKGVGEGFLHPRKVVLIASAGNAQRTTARNSLFWFLAKAGKIVTSVWPFSSVRDALRKKLYRAARSDYLAAGALTETFVKVISEDLTDDAAKVSVPALLIWGEDDDITPIADGYRMERVLPHAEMKAIPHAGHFVHRDASDVVAHTLCAYIV
jgi:pimeloyl-ACP methyl ester carboxylesterase